MADRQSINNNLHLLYKKLGETPHEAILRYKNEHPEYKETSMTYAGRLDPMAEGLLLVLSGEEILEKEKYLDLPKTYEFEMLWGFETDTLDVLGLVQKFENRDVQTEKIEEYLKNSIGKFEQIYPVYSSRPVDGKSLFQWAREGRIGEVDIPKHTVELYEAEHLSRRFISKNDLLEDIKNKVGLVNGDFRQNEIVSKWEEILGETDASQFVIDKIKVKVSSGFYIRQLVSDLAESFYTKAIVFHINRESVGGYKIS
ncbi:MAG: tRNA pseudouridine55 synthase [Parcubacteria bacterium C7867-006]|nr:MAG: tRNA pseudouridine55 synthase [Parcubacteria bacterium C7867-006]